MQTQHGTIRVSAVDLTPLPPPAPAGVLPAFPISLSSPDMANAKAFPFWVINAVKGGNTQGLPVIAVALFWKAVGPNWSGTSTQNLTATSDDLKAWCIAKFRAALAAAKMKWDAQQNLTEFSNDSYLYCGDRVAEWVTVMNWMGDALTPQEHADAGMILDQAIWNTWNWTKANWNGKLYAWSGWAAKSNNGKGDPLNNYYIRSHLRGLIYWQIHSQSAAWRAKIDELMPIMTAAYQTLIDGGWPEGDGYGVSIWNLFQDLWLLKNAVGIDLISQARVAEHLDYWVHAVTPDFKSFPPIGDAPVMSISDSHRAILIWGILLVPDSPQAARARWLLAKLGQAVTRPIYYWMTCYDVSGPQSPRMARYYFARGVGHFFAYGDDGSMLCMQAGPYNQSHDHKDQGEFQLYVRGKWAIVTASVPSKSDILQSSVYHNVVVLRKQDGSVIEPEWLDPTPPEMQPTLDGNMLTIRVDLKKAFDNAPELSAWTRLIRYDLAGGHCAVADDLALLNGASGRWSATFMDSPAAQPDGSFLAGALTAKPSQTATATDWLIEDAGKFNQDAWRVEMGGATGYSVELSW